MGAEGVRRQWKIERMKDLTLEQKLVRQHAARGISVPRTRTRTPSLLLSGGLHVIYSEQVGMDVQSDSI